MPVWLFFVIFFGLIVVTGLFLALANFHPTQINDTQFETKYRIVRRED